MTQKRSARDEGTPPDYLFLSSPKRARDPFLFPNVSALLAVRAPATLATFLLGSTESCLAAAEVNKECRASADLIKMQRPCKHTDPLRDSRPPPPPPTRNPPNPPPIPPVRPFRRFKCKKSRDAPIRRCGTLVLVNSRWCSCCLNLVLGRTVRTAPREPAQTPERVWKDVKTRIKVILELKHIRPGNCSISAACAA